MRHPFDSTTSLVIVHTRLFGPSGDMVVDLALDTGASTTLISWPTAIALGYDPSRSGQRQAVTTGSGSEYCPMVRVAQVEALGRRLREVDVLCHDLPARTGVRGLLGLNFFRRFDLRINFKDGFITLR